MLISQIINRISFWENADRIGPDIPYTHWRLYFKLSMLKLCKNKFKYFHDSAEIRPGAYVVCCSKISIGKRVVIRPLSMIMADDFAEIIIEDDVLLGPGVQIYVNNHRFDNSEIPIIDQGYYESKSVILKKGSWIGANAIILQGVTIGINAVVGAGVVVTKSVPDYGIIFNQNFIMLE